MKYLIILLLFCSCYPRKQQEKIRLQNVVNENKLGAKTDSLYSLHKKHHDIINNN